MRKPGLVSLFLATSIVCAMAAPASAAGFRSGDHYVDSIKTSSAQDYLWRKFTKSVFKY